MFKCFFPVYGLDGRETIIAKGEKGLLVKFCGGIRKHGNKTNYGIIIRKNGSDTTVKSNVDLTKLTSGPKRVILGFLIKCSSPQSPILIGVKILN